MVLLGLMALLCDAWPSGGRMPAAEAGEPIPIRLEELRGPAYRLLPGVGPVLAERLESARVAAGGVLDAAAAAAVRGVGPTLLARWAVLRAR